jgi:acetamidase/formamidase
MAVVLHEIPLERRTVHGHFSRDLAPVATIAPGDSVAFSALNSGWEASPRQPAFDDLDPVLDSGHALVGPIEVRGARAGQTLAVSIDEVMPGSWGVTLAEEEPFWWELDPVAGTGRGPAGRTVQLAPFLGVLGMPPAEPGVHTTIPPRRNGGNLDCKELVAGSTLFLPIPVDGALFSAGDGHARQGDGEVSGTAIECPLERVRLTLAVRDDVAGGAPVARTADAWLTFGFDEDLDRAADAALAAMLELMGRELRVGRLEALALASVAVDLRVTQVVNESKGVHAVLRDDALGIARDA